MKILVIGSGGREHALCWKIAQSERVDKIYAAPGNGGISEIAECVDIKVDDISSLISFAKENSIDLTIVEPEAPLVAGIVDRFKEEGLRIFGPDKYTAQFEGSKVFAKKSMVRFDLATADFRVFDRADEAKEHIAQKGCPLVIKADGLAAGKGVIIAQSEEEAFGAVDDIMLDKKFGSSGDSIIIEECLNGEEASIILICDGENFVTLASSQDHKRVFDDDKGPNTGGMGAYSPAPVVTDEIAKKIEEEIAVPLINGLTQEGAPYKGVLYIGLMIVEGKPYILEFNVRFGDPETQAILPRLRTDLVDLLEASIDNRIKDIRLDWDKRPCVCVVCASGGYPGSYEKDISINGLDKASRIEGLVVFHAGTKVSDAESKTPSFKTSGGRVLGVTALGEDIGSAIDRAYKGCSLIDFKGMHYRKDIGHRALKG